MRGAQSEAKCGSWIQLEGRCQTWKASQATLYIPKCQFSQAHDILGPKCLKKAVKKSAMPIHKLTQSPKEIVSNRKRVGIKI